MCSSCSSFSFLLNISHTIVAMNGNPDKGITKSNTMIDIHKETTRERGNKNNTLEDAHESEHGHFLSLQDQYCSRDELFRPPGGDQNRGSCYDPACVFWGRGLANWKALDTRSNGSGKIGDTTALIKESCTSPAGKHGAESASTYSRIEIDSSRLPSSLESDSTSATPSKMVHQAQPLPISSVPVSDEFPTNMNEPISLPLGHPLRFMAPDAGAYDQCLDLEAKKCRSPTPASLSNPSKESLNGNEYKSLKGADAVPSYTESISSTVRTYVGIEDNLQIRPVIGKIKPAIPIGLNFKSKTSHLSQNSGLSAPKPRQTPETPSKPSNTLIDKGMSSVNPTSHPFGSRPVIPITPIIPITPKRNNRIGHLKSLSADAPAYQPSAPSGPPTTPMSSYRNDDQRSASIGSRHSSPSYVSVMPNTPYWQRSAPHSRQASMGTPSIPIESGVLSIPGASSQLSPVHQFPGPQQHTPEGQGQYFDTQGPLPLPMPAHFLDPLSPNGPHFPSSLRSFHHDTVHQSAQVYEQGEQNAEYSQSNHFDSYATSQAATAAPNAADLHQNGNIYTQDANGYGPRYYSNHTDPAHQARLCPLRIDHAKLIEPQLNQNLYSPLEPYRESSKPNQRTAKDMFLSEDLRLKLHARTEATLRVFAGRLL